MVQVDRLATVTKLFSGAHRPDGKMCLMEAVVFVADEPWSDHPACACPVLAAYGRALNDLMPDNRRHRLIPLIPKLVGTKASREVEQRRAYLLADVAVRVLAPIALRAAKLDDQAAKLEALPEITDNKTAAAAAASAAYAADAAAYAADAAYAAAYAADVPDAKVWGVAIDAFERVIAVQGG